MSMSMSTVSSRRVGSESVGGGSEAIAFDDLERHRRELTGYCYRMLGSGFDAEDAVQETMIRAWRRQGDLEDPAALRAWLYRIATNVCMDALRSAKRRARPMDAAGPSSWPSDPGTAQPESGWVWPVPDDRVVPPDADPAEMAAARDSIRLAFVAALQHLPARQRAVLILRDVLRWRAAEVAELLDVSAVAVNSALQRARTALSDAAVARDRPAPTDPEQEALLARYVEAFETFDLDALTSLLHLEASLSMPPYDRWLRGPEQLRDWWEGPGNGCRGSLLCRVTANGSPAFGQYRPDGKPWALQVLELADGKITAINSFLDTDRLFPLFGLPPASDVAAREPPLRSQ
jgi:RNA polymerase sigma-70 factor, ECF subfamily